MVRLDIGGNKKLAIWQFQCFIVPLIKNADKLRGDEIISRNNVEKPLIYPDFLECRKSCSADIVQYGNVDETCIEIIYYKGKLEEINCRLDLRTLTKHNLAQIVEYVQRIEACFLVNDEICLPELEMIISSMEQSKANQYCKSPLEYFKDIDQRG